jgi:hypothetical protein
LLRGRVERQQLLLPWVALLAQLQLHAAGLEALGAERQAERYAQQIGVLEFHARTLVAIVDQHLEPQSFELGFEASGRRDHRRLIAELHQVNLEGGHRERQHHAVLIVVLLDERG